MEITAPRKLEIQPNREEPPENGGRRTDADVEVEEREKPPPLHHQSGNSHLTSLPGKKHRRGMIQFLTYLDSLEQCQ